MSEANQRSASRDTVTRFNFPVKRTASRILTQPITGSLILLPSTLNVPATLAAGRRIYVASLNHAIWLHRPPRADEWMFFDCASPSAASGRGFTNARVYDRAGRLFASVTQECLVAMMDE